MHLAIVRIKFLIAAAGSLKDRRNIMESFKMKLGKTVFIAVAEMADDILNHAEIWVAILAQSPGLLTQRLADLDRRANTLDGAEVLTFDKRDDFDLKE